MNSLINKTATRYNDSLSSIGMDLKHVVEGGTVFNSMKKEKICGIYKIVSPAGRIYIGQSVDILRRKKEYEKGYYKYQTRLKHSIQKYGWENHEFEILIKCDISDLFKWEDYYIKSYDTFGTEHGLNLKEAGVKGKLSEETKQKLSKNSAKNMLGKHHTHFTKQLLRISSTGNKNASGIRTEEMKLTMKIAQNKRPKKRPETGLAISKALQKSEKFKKAMRCPKRIKKIIAARKSYVVSEETKRKMKIAQGKRKPLSQEIKDRIAQGNRERNKLRLYKKGYKLSEEHKNKISVSNKGVKKSPRKNKKN